MTDGQIPVLLVRTSRRRVALLLTDVAELMRALPVEPQSGLPAYVLGWSLIRGAPRLVIDLGARLGDGTGGQPTRYVLVRTGSEPLALAVDTVDGITTLSPAPAAAFAAGRDPLVADLAVYEQQPVAILSPAMLLIPPAERPAERPHREAA